MGKYGGYLVLSYKPIALDIPRWSPIQVLTGPILLSFWDQAHSRWYGRRHGFVLKKPLQHVSCGHSMGIPEWSSSESLLVSTFYQSLLQIWLKIVELVFLFQISGLTKTSCGNLHFSFPTHVSWGLDLDHQVRICSFFSFLLSFLPFMIPSPRKANQIPSWGVLFPLPVSLNFSCLYSASKSERVLASQNLNSSK